MSAPGNRRAEPDVSTGMRRSLIPAVIAAPLLLAGCGAAAANFDPSHPDTDEVAAVTVEPEDLWGKAFQAQNVTGSDSDVELMSGVEFVLSFEEGSVGAYGFCNHMGASAELRDGRLVTSDVFSTQMACEEPAMAIDSWIVELLDAQPHVELDGDRLTLTTDEITVELTESTE